MNKKVTYFNPLFAESDYRKSLFASKLDTCNMLNKRLYNKQIIVGKKQAEVNGFCCLQSSSKEEQNSTKRSIVRKSVVQKKSLSFLKVDELNYLQIANQIRKQ